MRYLREHTDLHIAETDEEVMKANNNVWPDNELKNNVLVPQTTNEIINRSSVVYFASYIPTDLLLKAKAKGFYVVVLGIPIEELEKRNQERMKVESYDDVSQWFRGQLDNFDELLRQKVVDRTIDGNRQAEKIAKDITGFTKNS